MTDPVDQPTTLGDLLRVLRQRRLLIGLVTFVCAAAALGFSVVQQPEYSAKASLAYEDVSEDLSLIGLPQAPQRTQEQLAAAGAQTAVSANNARRVREALNSTRSAASLRDAVTATIDSTSNFVVIEARSGDASEAAVLANAFARAAAGRTNTETRQYFLDAARKLRARVSRLRRSSPRSVSALALTDQIGRLESLGVLARPAQVVELAQTPSSPVSPRPIFNTAIGVILGLILGIFAAFLRDAFDARLRDQTDVTQQLDLPLLGSLSEDALGRSPHAVGPSEVMNTADLESIRMLRSNLLYLDVDRPTTTVAVTSATPEEGKSTIAASLAFIAASAGKRTLLVECDLRRPVLAERLGLEHVPGLTDFLMGNARPADIVQPIRFDTVQSPSTNGSRPATDRATEATVACIVAGTLTPRSAELLESARFKHFLSEVSSVYDLVILDTSPLLVASDTLEIIPVVDGVILCVRALQTTREQARAGKAALDRFPNRPTGVVVTGGAPAGALRYGYSYDYTYAARD